MRLCGNLAIFLFLAWLAPRDSAGREKRRERPGGKSKNRVAVRGQLQGRGGALCTWTVRGETQYTLNVTCTVEMKQPVCLYTCSYTAEPALCPQFAMKPNTYWRQTSRAVLQHKKHLCKGGARREAIRVRMCESAPAGAHFRLVNPSKEITLTTTTTPAVRVGLAEDTPTAECSDHGPLAQEKCGPSWASLCNFLFSMVQGKEC